MQKLLTRYKTARAELDTPPNSVAQIMECDEARMQLIRALGAPYNISHDALVERAVHSIAGDAVMAEWRPYKAYILDRDANLRGLLSAYVAAYEVTSADPKLTAGFEETMRHRKALIAALHPHVIGGAPHKDLVRIAEKLIHSYEQPREATPKIIQKFAPFEAPPITEIDDYSDMKPLHVSPLTWAVAIVAFIIIWSLAIYGGYRLVMECIL